MSKVSEVKKRPKCEGEMKKGYLTDAPWWRRGERLLAWGFGPLVFAYRCKDCGNIEL